MAKTKRGGGEKKKAGSPSGAAGKKGGGAKRRKIGIIRKKPDSPDEDIAPYMENKSGEKSSKKSRIIYYQKYKVEKAVRKLARREKRKKEREQHGEDVVPKMVPKTTDNMREADDTFVTGSDEEIEGDEADDEYREFYEEGVEPLILLTTGSDPCLRTRRFVPELLTLFPNTQYFERRGYTVKQITQYAVNRGFTDIIIVGDSGGGQKRKPYSMIISHLPQGPTHWYRVSSVVLHNELETPGERSEHFPELILKGFTTRLGKRIVRQFNSMFPQQPDKKGRAVTTFLNHRDFIFVRSHRYLYENTESVRLQELGPRFTLRLRSLQAGLFDPQFGEYEWFRKKKEMDKSRRKFHL